MIELIILDIFCENGINLHDCKNAIIAMPGERKKLIASKKQLLEFYIKRWWNI